LPRHIFTQVCARMNSLGKPESKVKKCCIEINRGLPKLVNILTYCVFDGVKDYYVREDVVISINCCGLMKMKGKAFDGFTEELAAACKLSGTNRTCFS